MKIAHSQTIAHVIVMISILGWTTGCGPQKTTKSTTEEARTPQAINRDTTPAEPVTDPAPNLAAVPTSLTGAGTTPPIHLMDPEAAPPKVIKDVAVPNAGPVAIKTASLPVTNDCISEEKELSFRLSLLSEELEQQKIMYSQTPASALSDCSGIFFRIAQYAATVCQNYQYPDPKQTRDSRSVARWFYDHNNLVLIQDAKASRNLIRPGSVMFFGRSGVKYANVTLDLIAGTPQQRGVITHMGVVTEVKRDDKGDIIGYVMMHGRRKGVTAQRSHYHQLKPPRSGFPVLGNWSQQWVAVANLMTPAFSDQVIATNQTGSTTNSGSAPTPAATSEPASSAQSGNLRDFLPASQTCASSDGDWSKQLTRFAEGLEGKNLMYTQSPPDLLQDCSGIYFRMAQFAASQCGDYEFPDPKQTRDSRSLARWYHNKGNLAIVQDPMASRNLIRPGSVMFFGRSGERYSNLTIERIAGTPQKRGVITHIGVVTEVTYDDVGKVTGYVMMHGRRPGKAAKRSHYHKVEPPKIGYPVLGNWQQQWVAIANIMTPKGGAGLASN